MVTIKDIAKLAGVAQGTVSNVLNGRGNVSSEKIRRVMDAAAELGYVPNERAALLRRGASDCLAVIMPNSRAKQYQDFYSGFKARAQTDGFTVSQILTSENNPAGELEALSEARSLLTRGIACILASPASASKFSAFEEEARSGRIVFVERKPGFPADFIGFDYEKAGFEMGQKAVSGGYRQICLLTEDLRFSSEAEFFQGFMRAAAPAGITVSHIQTDSSRRYQNIFQILSGPLPEAFFISNYRFAESVKDICSAFCASERPADIYTVSPLFTMPECDFIKYELNYMQLGRAAAERLITKYRAAGKKTGHIKEGHAENGIARDSALGKEKKGEEKTERGNTGLEKTSEPARSGSQPDFLPGSSIRLANIGFRDWFANITVPKCRRPLNIITLDSPEAYVMRNLSRLYTQKTGIDVNICIFSHDEAYEILNSLDTLSSFDILRLDVTWLSWFADRILLPLEEADPDIESIVPALLDGTAERYGRVHGRLCALPSTPSVQLLYYRKDLFESPIYKRMYFEQFKKELRPPQSFEEFNQIAGFFTRRFNPSSPVDYGATITLGSTSVASSEYLARLFSRQENLYDRNLEIHLDSEAGLASLRELIELRNFTSPAYCGWWMNTAKAFAGGSYAMAILYSNYASEFLDPASSIVGNIGFCPVPGNNPIIGGGCLGISRYSSRPEDAVSFLRWFLSEPVSSASALLGSTSPRRETYQNYEILNNFPWMALSEKCFALSKCSRQPAFAPHPFDERRFMNLLGMAVKNTYSNICTPEQALKTAQEQMRQHFVTSFRRP